MSSANLDKNFDEKVDYYAILGVSKEASNDEIKKAHVSLALKHHPDMMRTDGGKFGMASDSTQFRKISEAWAVLGKPEMKSSYDSARAELFADRVSGIGLGKLDGLDHTHIPEGVHERRAHFTNVVQKNAASNWEDIIDKYKTDKWNEFTLDQKKNIRTRKVHSAGGVLGGMAVGGVMLLGAMYVAYTSYYPAHKRRTSGVIRNSK